MPLAADIASRVERDFPSGDSASVMELLIELQRAQPETFEDRILRCLLQVARGSFDDLSAAVILARTDVRDLIVAAEYDAELQRIRDLSRPFAGGV